MEKLRIGGEAKVGYMGGNAWTGCNYKGYMRYSEINKIVKKAFKDKYPNVKVSCTGKSFSGGQECNGTIILKLSDAVYSYDEFVENANKNGYYPMINSWYYCEDGSCVWGEKIDKDTRLKCTYNNYINGITCKYYGERLNHVSDLDKSILKPEVIEMVEYLNALYDSFNDYDINGMVDYFDTLFYKDVEIRCENE